MPYVNPTSPSFLADRLASSSSSTTPVQSPTSPSTLSSTLSSAEKILSPSTPLATNSLILSSSQPNKTQSSNLTTVDNILSSSSPKNSKSSNSASNNLSSQPHQQNQPLINSVRNLPSSSTPMTPPVISRFNPLGSSSISSSSSSSSSSTMTLTTTSKPSPPAGCIFVHPASPMEQQPFKPAENLNHNRSLSGSLPYIRPPATVNYSNTLFRSMSASSNQNISKPTSNNIQRPPYHQKTQSESGKSSPISFVNCKPMIRKKSGEPLRSSLKSASLSPSSSANSQLPTPPNQTPIPKSDLPQVWDQKLNSTSKSAPATPSSGTKFVHFDSHLEHVRHFLSQQRPIAVSRDQSPVETETEGEEEFPFPVMIKMVNQRSGMDGTVTSSSSSDEQASSLSHPRLIELPNIDKSSCTSDLVKLRSLELVKSGREIKGEVKVRNISYEKVVAARFTFDDWRTVSEVTGDFDKAIDNDYDQFVFSIRIHDGVGLAALKGAG
ncbi:expressed protein, partial [Phakopsora pachyrhizi]